MFIKYTKKILQDAVNNSVSYAGVLRHLKLKPAGGTQSHIKKRINDFKISIYHFTGQAHNKGKISRKRLSPDELLVYLKENSNRTRTHQLVRALLEIGIKYKCSKCGNDDNWMGEKLTLHVDHIDGIWLNNERDNLRFLCPNCHSQTKTFAGKNIKN